MGGGGAAFLFPCGVLPRRVFISPNAGSANALGDHSGRGYRHIAHLCRGDMQRSGDARPGAALLRTMSGSPITPTPRRARATRKAIEWLADAFDPRRHPWFPRRSSSIRANSPARIRAALRSCRAGRIRGWCRSRMAAGCASDGARIKMPAISRPAAPTGAMPAQRIVLSTSRTVAGLPGASRSRPLPPPIREKKNRQEGPPVRITPPMCPLALHLRTSLASRRRRL